MEDSLEFGEEKTEVISVKSTLTADISGKACLVIIYGKNLGKKIEFSNDDIITIGRDPSNSITLKGEGVSRKHAKIGYIRNTYEIIDLKSTNGTIVNDSLITRAKLKNGDLIKIGNIVLKFLFGSDLEASYHEEIYRMTIYDGLTQIYNKRYAIELLEKEISRARRHQRPLSVLMIDIDHFKNINDTHGHLTGDHVLKELAGVINHRIRREELFARFGGEEFLIILPESDKQGSLRFAEILKDLVNQHEFKCDNVIIPVTVSIGVSVYDSSRHSAVSNFLEEADKNLYVAKNNGRNCVFG